MSSEFIKSVRHLVLKCEYDLHYIEYAGLEDDSFKRIDFIRKEFENKSSAAKGLLLNEFREIEIEIRLSREKILRLSSDPISSDHSLNLSILYNSMIYHISELLRMGLEFIPDFYKKKRNRQLMEIFLKRTDPVRKDFEEDTMHSKGPKKVEIKFVQLFKNEIEDKKRILDIIENDFYSASPTEYAYLIIALKEMGYINYKNKAVMHRCLEEFFPKSNVGSVDTLKKAINNFNLEFDNETGKVDVMINRLKKLI